MRQTFAILWLLILLMACSKQGDAEGAQTAAVDTTALRVAVMPTLDCLPIYMAHDRGLFQRHGVDVSLLPFRAQMDCDTAIERGWAEAVVSDLVRTEYLQQRGVPLRYVAATNLGWQLVSNKMARIKQLSGLDDKMIAMTRFSATALLADRAVEQAQLDPDYVYRIQVNDIDVRLGMLQNGVVDAMLLPEPQATQARQMGAPVLLDSRDQDLQLGVIAFAEQALKQQRRVEQMGAFLKAYNEACDSINTQGIKNYWKLVEKYCNVPLAVVDSMPHDVHFEHAREPRPSDLETARKWLGLN